MNLLDNLIRRGRFSSTRSRMVLSVIALCLLIYATLHVLPARTIRIAVGPVNGSFYENAVQYKHIVERKGYRVEIVPFQNTDEISTDVADDSQHLDLGFVAEDLSHAVGEKLMSLGDVQLQPIFIFLNRKHAAGRPIHSYSDLRGMALVLPPERSLTSRALLSIFALSGINQQNTQLHFLPLDDGMARLQRGEFDAGLFILDPSSPLIAGLAKDPRLLMVHTTEQQAIAKKLSYLRVVTLPAGVFDLSDHVPEQDIDMLAATISVVARREMPAATQYALLEAMHEVHSKGSYVSHDGEFPHYVNKGDAADSPVDDFYRDGTPWVYAHFSIWIASVIDAYLAPLLAVWFAMHVLDTFSELENARLFVLLSLARTLLWWVKLIGKRGATPSVHTQALIRGIEAAMAREKRGTDHILKELRGARRR